MGLSARSARRLFNARNRAAREQVLYPIGTVRKYSGTPDSLVVEKADPRWWDSGSLAYRLNVRHPALYRLVKLNILNTYVVFPHFKRYYEVLDEDRLKEADAFRRLTGRWPRK